MSNAVSHSSPWTIYFRSRFIALNGVIRIYIHIICIQQSSTQHLHHSDQRDIHFVFFAFFFFRNAIFITSFLFVRNFLQLVHQCKETPIKFDLIFDAKQIEFVFIRIYVQRQFLFNSYVIIRFGAQELTAHCTANSGEHSNEYFMIHNIILPLVAMIWNWPKI